MSPFEFFFSFYGLLLALSVATVAMGLVKALKLRAKGTLGRMTPLLAVFVMMDIASFWSWAWDSMRNTPFSYGLLIIGMLIALIYFAAASFVFPEDEETRWATLDEHYDARKRYVLIPAMVSNTIMIAAAFALTHASLVMVDSILGIVFWAFYVITLSVCCLVKNRTINAVMLWLNILLYVFVAVVTLTRVPPGVA